MNLRKLKKKVWPKRVMKLNKRYQKYIVPFNGELRILELVLIAHGTVASGKQPRKLMQALLKKQVNHRYSAYIIYLFQLHEKTKWKRWREDFFHILFGMVHKAWRTLPFKSCRKTHNPWKVLLSWRFKSTLSKEADVTMTHLFGILRNF